jgi:hypothetical protein
VQLHVHVELPPGARTLAVVPAADSQDDARITYRVSELRPLEAVSFVVAYRVSTHRPGYRRLARAFADALSRQPEEFTESPQGW